MEEARRILRRARCAGVLKESHNLLYLALGLALFEVGQSRVDCMRGWADGLDASVQGQSLGTDHLRKPGVRDLRSGGGGGRGTLGCNKRSKKGAECEKSEKCAKSGKLQSLTNGQSLEKLRSLTNVQSLKNGQSLKNVQSLTNVHSPKDYEGEGQGCWVM